MVADLVRNRLLPSLPLSDRYSSMISRVPFCTNLREDLIVDICQQINQFSVLPGDTIMQKGDPYRELIILAKGTARSIGRTFPYVVYEDQSTAQTGSVNLYLSPLGELADSTRLWDTT
jgi:hypothetical protein